MDMANMALGCHWGDPLFERLKNWVKSENLSRGPPNGNVKMQESIGLSENRAPPIRIIIVPNKHCKFGVYPPSSDTSERKIQAL